MAERDRRQLDAIGRIQRLFLSGEDASVLRAEIVAAAVELAGARSGFLLEEGPRDEPEAIASAGGAGGARVVIPLVGRSGPAGALGLEGVRATTPELRRDLAPFLDSAALLLRGWQNLREQAALTQNLHDSEELHRIVTETGYEYSYIATIQEDGRVHLYTPRPDVAAAFAGVTPGMDPPDWHDFADPRDHPAVQRSHQELEEHGVCRAAFRLARRGADGRVRWVEKVERLVRGPGPTVRVFGAIRDITREREAAEQLREREREIRAILESEPEWVNALDREGRVLHTNPAGLQMIEAESLREIRGASIFDVIAPEHREAFRHLHERVFAGDSVVQEFEIVGLRGTRRWMETHAAPLRNEDGAVVSHLAITRDVTERRRLQEELIAAQRREALGVMAGGIAHDFNNMLYVILGRSELALRKAGEGSPAARDLAEIRAAARRAAGVTQQILTYSRGSLGEDRPVDLRETIDEALAMLRATLPATVQIRARRGDAPRTVFGDPTQLLQIVVNLATNSAHAVRDKSDGEIELALEEIQVGAGGLVSAPYLTPGSYVRLRARDRGCGMPPEVRLRALEPYFSTKPPSEGSGLGLAVVDGIVRRLGGAVRIESEPGAGTTVDVLLPAYAGPAAHSSDVTLEAPRGRETVLLVEDEKMVRDTERHLLESLGYQVVAATDATEALRALRADPARYDLLITDQTMPHITGEALAREALRLRPDLPVIVCTGHQERLPAERASQIGIRACLTKPIELERLARTIRAVLEADPSRVSSAAS
jgi:PAS domain S-box-containing protein